jgi:3-oxoadipate enol-lactonase
MGEPRRAVEPTVLPVRDEGTGPALLLVHGLLSTGEAFRLLAPVLGQRYRLIAPDLRGHGQSRHLPGPDEAERLAADLLPTLDALGLETVHVLGYSHGGASAQVFARTHPDRVRSLILVSTYAQLQLTWRERLGSVLAPPMVALLGTRLLARLVRWRRTAGGGRRLSREAAALGETVMAANDGRRMAGALWAARRFKSRGWLSALQVPTLIVVGEQDAIVSPRQARLLASGIPGAQLHPVPDGGHQLPLSHPDELATLVSAWLANIDRPGG